MTRSKAQQAIEAGQLQLRDAFTSINFREFPGLLLLSDIENTTAPRGERKLSDDTLQAFERAYHAGYRYVILRTNKKRKLVKAPLEMRALSTYTGDFEPMKVQLEALGFEVVLVRQPQQVFWPPWAFGKWPRKPWRTTFYGDLNQLYDENWGNLIKRTDVMVVGDKFRFDCLRPLLMGWNAVLVNPIGPDGKGDKLALIRPIERFTLWRLGLKRPAQTSRDENYHNDWDDPDGADNDPFYQEHGY